ncbi:MAG: sialidase family protein [Candidatus Brocadiia bacterium]
MSLYNIVPGSKGESDISKETPDGILIHQQADELDSVPVGKFIRLQDGRIFGVAGRPGQAQISDDEGKTWNEVPIAKDGTTEISPSGAVLSTNDGTVLVACSDLAEKNWTWDNELKDAPGATLPTCVIRSVDNGESWEPVQKLHNEWTGATRDMIQTQDGRIVLCTMKLLHNPGRHAVMTYVSDDDGQTWEEGDLLDLGGNGHHDGTTEGTVVELRDGRILQYIRTNWGEFWRAVSEDGGKSWHPYGPSGVPASSAPAILTRLKSGRIMMLWNRPFPEGETSYPLRGGQGIWSATPTSNYREELSMSFSEDECNSWSAPVVLARNPDSEVSYPLAFEREPGRVWVTAWRWNLGIAINEADFAG